MTKRNGHQRSLWEIIDLKQDGSWRQEWEDMPEFVQDDLTSYRKIIIHFRNDEDVQEFARLIGQHITAKQPSLWFPEMPPRRYAHLLYIDGEQDES